MIEDWLSLRVPKPKEVIARIEFSESPKDMPWQWRHANTKDPPERVVEFCPPLPSVTDVDSGLMR